MRRASAVWIFKRRIASRTTSTIDGTIHLV
jgi:hypothetical protein